MLLELLLLLHNRRRHSCLCCCRMKNIRLCCHKKSHSCFRRMKNCSYHKMVLERCMCCMMVLERCSMLEQLNSTLS